jgi:hypothetical protein
VRLFFWNVFLANEYRRKIQYKKLRFWNWFSRTTVGKWLERRRIAYETRLFWEGEWPKEDADPRFGYTTTAKVRGGVAQDAKLIQDVEKLLKEAQQHSVQVEPHK